MIIFTSNIFFALSVTTRWHVFLKCNHLFSDLSLWCLFTLNLINIYPRPVLTHQLLLLGRPKLVLTKTSAKWLDDHSPTWRAMEFVNKSPVTVWKCGNGISSIYSMSATGDFSSWKPPFLVDSLCFPTCSYDFPIFWKGFGGFCKWRYPNSWMIWGTPILQCEAPKIAFSWCE